MGGRKETPAGGDEAGIPQGPGRESQGIRQERRKGSLHEPFYRSRKKVDIGDIVNEIFPLEVKLGDESKLSHEECLKVRRLRRRIRLAFPETRDSLLEEP